MEEKDLKNLIPVTKDGEEYIVPPGGSLSLLALGYIGLKLWRNAKTNSSQTDKVSLSPLLKNE